MIAIPAVDLREGACVQLVGGSYDDERVRIEDPLSAAREWARLGFRRLHIVDLDAAMGVGSNQTVIERMIGELNVEVQVGGGIRTVEQASALLALGVAAVVAGTRAIEDPAWLSSLANDYPGRVIVAADVRDRRILTRGWTRDGGSDVLDFIAGIASAPLAGVLVTAVHQEGRMAGPDLGLVADVARQSSLPLIASGGIRSLDDLQALADRGASAAVVGMALYTGALDPNAAAIRFAS